MPLTRNSKKRLSWLAAAWLLLPLPGCALLNPPSEAHRGGGAFAWLTNWVNQPLDATDSFDVETLRPEPSSPVTTPDDLLEVTIWNLYEPGMPYTFPVRVSNRLTIDVPLIQEVSVADLTLPQVENAVIDGLRDGEILNDPKVLVRSLDPLTVKVQVSGALVRTGFMELPRQESNVYGALVSAGGLKRTASSQIAVVRHSCRPEAPPVQAQRRPPSASAVSVAGAASGPPEEHANSVEVLSVDPGAPPDDRQSGPEENDAKENEPIATKGGESLAPATARGRLTDFELRQRDQVGLAGDAGELTTWFDLDRPDHREALKRVRLTEGDEVVVKALAPPVRIGGVVARPGAYPLPAGRSVNVWQAIDMAGGLQAPDVPLHITLIRPAADGRPAQRKSLHVPDFSKHPLESPPVEAGDVLHVEPTTGSRIKQAVGDLWSKP